MVILATVRQLEHDGWAAEQILAVVKGILEAEERQQDSYWTAAEEQADRERIAGLVAACGGCDPFA